MSAAEGAAGCDIECIFLDGTVGCGDLRTVAHALCGAGRQGLPNMASKLLAPSLAHPSGTDEMGRDLLAWGSPWRTDIAAAGGVGDWQSLAVGVVVGPAAGQAAAGSTRRRCARPRVPAFPPLLLAILLVAVLGGGFTSVVLALALVRLFMWCLCVGRW